LFRRIRPLLPDALDNLDATPRKTARYTPEHVVLQNNRMTTHHCAAGIVFAVPIEAEAFARAATDVVEMEAAGLTFHEGQVGGSRVAWCVAGVGREAARRAARLIIDGHRPRLLVSAGFGGGLDPALARGAVVEPAAVLGEEPTCEPLPLAAAGQGGGAIVTVDRIVRTPMEKAALAAATGAAVVDMETRAVAEVARDAGLPCRGIRVISDAAGDELPPDVTRLIAPQSAFRRAGAVIGMLGRRPRAALDLWQLWERAVVDGRTLSAALVNRCGSLAAVAER
jgi:adenosylhomocysteine nucleosidase